MRCAACGAVNDQGRAYCAGCARSLGDACPVCQFLNGEGVRYCGGCARDLLAAVAEPPPVAAAVPAPTPDAAQASPTRIPAAVFDDLDDLRAAPAAAAAPPKAAAAETTQDEIDGFFRRLVREGVAEMQPSGVSAQPPGPPRRAPS
jgi:hypothetical protein